MKKFLALLLALVMVFALAACGSEPAPTTSENPGTEPSTAPSANGETAGVPEDFKVGFIFLHDENSTYDLNFINAANAAIEELGLTEDQYVFRTNIAETQDCYDAAAELADEGCDILFADSCGHESFMIQAA